MTPSQSHSDLTPICGNNMFNISQGVKPYGMWRPHRSMVDGIAGRRALTIRQLRHMLRLRHDGVSAPGSMGARLRPPRDPRKP
jgi:hypothetical protein